MPNHKVIPLGLVSASVSLKDADIRQHDEVS